MTFTVQNTGDLTSGTISVRTIGLDAADFSIGGSDCGPPLPPSGACYAFVTFTPSSPGVKTADLEASASPGGAVTSKLDGVGVNPALLAISPNMWDFGMVRAGTSSQSITFTVRNDGAGTTGPLAISLGGSFQGDYVVEVDGCSSMSLQGGGGSCVVVLTFAPTGQGRRDAALIADATPGGMVQAMLTGTGT
jgi:hypothetical protein